MSTVAGRNQTQMLKQKWDVFSTCIHRKKLTALLARLPRQNEAIKYVDNKKIQHCCLCFTKLLISYVKVREDHFYF